MTPTIENASVLSRVTSVVSEVLNVPEDEVTPEANFREDLDAESLDLISIISELEEQFDRDISDDDAMSLQTVGDAVKFIEGRTEQIAEK